MCGFWLGWIFDLWFWVHSTRERKRETAERENTNEDIHRDWYNCSWCRDLRLVWRTPFDITFNRLDSNSDILKYRAIFDWQCLDINNKNYLICMNWMLFYFSFGSYLFFSLHSMNDWIKLWHFPFSLNFLKIAFESKYVDTHTHTTHFVSVHPILETEFQHTILSMVQMIYNTLVAYAFLRYRTCAFSCVDVINYALNAIHFIESISIGFSTFESFWWNSCIQHRLKFREKKLSDLWTIGSFQR